MTNSNTITFEHERRFYPKLSELPANFYNSPRTLIVQGYLEDDLRTRVRDESDELGSHTYSQTRKTGGGVSRPEDEIEISKEVFTNLWAHVKCELRKTRYHMPLYGHVAEINIFHDNLDHYVQIEVEFASPEEALKFVPPSWFGDEVTHDNCHDNYYLAKHGITFAVH